MRGYTPALAREVAEERARTEWRRMGARSEHEALGIFVHDVHRRWGSVRVLAVVGARHPRPPARHREAERRDPPPRPAVRVRAWASGRGRGAEPWPRVHPGILRGVRAAAGL